MATTAPRIITPPAAPPPTNTVAGTNDIRDIKPPVAIPGEWLWLWITLGALAVGLALTGLILWLVLRKRAAQPPPVPYTPPHLRAKQRLEEALALIHDARLFCIAVSNALRVYLEERFHYHAPDRTTEEFLVELQSATSLYPDQKRSLGEFLEACDLVKFARHEPPEQALRELHESAVRLVDETQFDAAPAAGAASTRSS